ncbi:hypothetical protein ACFGVS_11185 [Mucilaginibacter sp. AW1-7]|uniref:hypothetical protein n=1 Tax=unclassified Mucilaginibacter TaxID=2617802 RepID=UPI0023656DC2|nr:hypothetical protein [Mucilaginibacter sp. KACC 22773]WDF79842.1 hypothetical protein PQ469_07455 [Mucilaginibacter sp. KACC 22773]
MNYSTITSSDMLTGFLLHEQIKYSINQIYPVGLNKNTIEYKQHPKIVLLMQNFENRTNNHKQYYQPWIIFLKKLRAKSKKSIRNCSGPFDTCFSGELILEEYEDMTFRRVKRLFFSVSQVADFFTVYGMDETFIKDKEMPSEPGYRSINVITESPYSEFKIEFNYLQTAIAEQYPGYKFVPIRVSLDLVKGLQTPYSYTDQCSIHSALFDASFELNPVRFFRGEKYYGSGITNISVSLPPPPPIG